MKTWTWGVALAVTTAGVAAAQPGPPPAPTPVGPPAAPAADNPPPPPPPPVMSAHRDEPRADPGRPAELAFGIGVGYALPTSLQTPNTTSVRIRLPSGLTFEPQLVFATTSDDAATTSTQQTELTLGSLVRYPLRVHNKVDLELVGNALVSNRVVDPSGNNNNRTVTTLALGYGVAIAYWFTPHWNLSITASNPLLAFSRTRQDTGVDLMTTTKTTTLGLVFDPQITLMVHLYD
jgi:hypothetical protein